jgi:hypothetical protein
MANRFSISPPNILESLMLGVQGYEGAQKRGRENDIRAARTEAGQAFQAGGDTRGAIARLVAAGDIPGAGVFSQLGKADTTDEIKEYNFDALQRQARGQPVLPFGEWKVGLKLAGATKINNSVNTGENKYDNTLAEANAKRFLDFQKTGQAASSQLNSLNVMERAMEDPNFYSGVGAERFGLPLKQAITAFGGDPKGAASMEVFRANSAKAVMDSMGGSLGAGFSNADRDFVLSQVPSLQNTPEGNKQLIEVTRAVAKRNQQIAQKARDYANRHGGRLDAGFDEELAAWSEKNPLFSQAAVRPAQPAAPRQGATPPPVKDAKQAPDGKWYVPDPNRPGKYLMIQQ